MFVVVYQCAAKTEKPASLNIILIKKHTQNKAGVCSRPSISHSVPSGLFSRPETTTAGSQPPSSITLVYQSRAHAHPHFHSTARIAPCHSSLPYLLMEELVTTTLHHRFKDPLLITSTDMPGLERECVLQNTFI